MNGDVHRLSAPKVLAGGAHVNAVFREDHALEFEVVFVALERTAAPGVNERDGDHAALQHQPRSGRQLLLVVPRRAKSEGDVGQDVGAVLGDLNGCRGVQFNQ